MTENEYINAKHLGHIISAKGALMHVVPECSDVIDKKEFSELMAKISQLEIRLFNAITTTETAEPKS